MPIICYIVNMISAIKDARRMDHLWILQTTICLLAIIIAFFMLSHSYIIFGAIILTAANFVHTTIYTRRESIQFTLFSTMLLFLMFFTPLNQLAVAAIIATVLSSLTGRVDKFFVNAVSLGASSLSAIYLFDVHEFAWAGVMAAGVLFEIINNITLLAGISYYGQDGLKDLFVSWRNTWALGLVPPLTALLLFYMSNFALGLPILIAVFVVLSRPKYFTKRYRLKGYWNTTAAIYGQ